MTNDPFSENYAKQRKDSRSFSGMVWAGSGIYLFWVNDYVDFFHWTGATYFILGTLLAYFVIGELYYVAERIIGIYTSALMVRRRWDFSTKGFAPSILILGWGLSIAFAVLIFYAADYMVSEFLYENPW